MSKADSQQDPLEVREEYAGNDEEHVYGSGIVCDTDNLGRSTPKGRSPLDLVVDATEGFVPLWASGSKLRWRFRPGTLNVFRRPADARTYLRRLMGEAILQWGDAAPVKFLERDDAWDFEIAIRPSDQCTANGCILASAFFPDAGRHTLTIYPKMFTQVREEQVETLVHEIGHVFGLRHFFANISETEWASEIFGTHRKFSIMNYGPDSKLTADDKTDLKRLYQLAWDGTLDNVNGTPIRFTTPYHTAGEQPGELLVGLPQVAFRR